ncbi:MAG: Lrp/AsnC family transcriptional regulator [Methanothrix sp.]|jgi:Lrp/AsnC family leucine-responsive transcriptional regulator|nr:MAG: Lrp/AsnC family transcriptional regulator [Methanothrix sp.]
MSMEALDYIKSHPEGVLQSDLWKVLKIDSRKCSRIVAKLLKDNLVTREVQSADGIRTYRLYYAEKTRGRRFDPLLAVNAFEPCAGCIEECVPEHCAKLSEWIFSIVMGVEGEVAMDIIYQEKYKEA